MARARTLRRLGAGATAALGGVVTFGFGSDNDMEDVDDYEEAWLTADPARVDAAAALMRALPAA